MTGDEVGPGDEWPTDGGDVASTNTPLVADGGPSHSQLFRAFPEPLLYYEVEAETAVVRAVNPEFERTFGVDDSTATGDSLADYLLVDAVDVDPCPTSGDAATTASSTAGTGRAAIECSAEDVLSRLSEGGRVTVTTRRGTDGERRYFRLGVVSLSDGEAGTCVVYTEVTGLERRIRDLEARAERLERFIDVAAHDLRNPLDVAKIRLEAARDTTENVHFEKAGAALDRIQRIVRDVLSVGSAEPDPSEGTVLGAVAEAAWSTVDTDAATLVLGGDLPTVEADGDLLQHLFENLFRNAVEHGSTSSPAEADDAVEHGSASNRPSDDNAAERGGDVTVTVGKLPGGFFVADDGRGVPPDQRGQVFDPGYSTADDNTGLGLAIVEQIAEDHGWSVGLTAAESGGARFEFTGVESDDPV